MPKDNYVVREKYEGLEEVDGQLVPKRGQVKPEDLVTTEPESEEAVKNISKEIKDKYNKPLLFWK